MSIEQKINQKLNKYPGIKKGIKRIYQRTIYTISPKIKSEGNIVRVSPKDPKHEYFFGYYDKCPEDATGRYVLCLKADDTWSETAPAAAAEILLIDTNKDENDDDRVKVIASTRTWNVQQGCMMQWLGPEFDREIIYNDFRDGRFCSVILNVFSGAERVLAAPVYSVSADGSFALTLDFTRLHRLRPGYGYSNILEETRNEKLPDTPAIWRLDLRTNTLEPLLRYTDFASFEPRPEMKQAEHKVNHIMLSPNGKRFMVLHRWFDGQRKYTRLVTVNTDGSEMYNLSDDDMVSHCCWKDDETIIAFENKKGQGAGYYLMHDKTQRYERMWPEMTADGHPSCSPDGQLVVTDTYPNRARMASVKVMRGNQVETIAKVFAPFKYDNDTRCDLHPRWSRDGKKIYFDSVFEGHRGLYCIEDSTLTYPILGEQEERKTINNPKYTIITPVYNSFHLMTRYFNSLSSQTFKNFEIVIVDDCSTDESFDELCEYAKVTPLTVRVFRTNMNGGPGAARNLGMDEARGEWITFVDNDDWVDNTFLERIEKVICENNVNAVIYDLYSTNGNDRKILKSMYHGENGLISLSDCVAYARNHAVGKVYKLRECRKGKIRYPDLRRCEDVAFVDRALVACGSVYYLKEPLYYYYRRPSSLSNNTKLGESDMTKAFHFIEEDLTREFPEEVKQKSVTDILYGALLMMCKSNKPRKEIIAYIDRYEQKYPDWESAEVIKYLGKGKTVFLKCAKLRNVIGMKAIAKVHSTIVAGKLG